MIASLLGILVLGSGPLADGPRDLRVGHWVEVRGNLSASGRFVAGQIEALPPGDYDLLIGTVTPGAVEDGGFILLGQPISISEKTEWSKTSLAEIAGTRVKVEGRWRGPRKFSARDVKLRGKGRDRIGGRIDEIEEATGGRLFRIMRFEVFVPDDVEFAAETPLEELALAPARVVSTTSRDVDEDDLFGKGIALTDDMRLSGQLEGKTTHEDNFDLDDSDDEDRTELEMSGRARISWTPGGGFRGVAEVRHSQRLRDDEKDGNSNLGNTRLGEVYGQWNDLLGPGWDVRVGRQDFDDAREWLYDQNLDAVRILGTPFGLPFELSFSTTLSSGSREDEETLNTIAYLSNGSEDRHLAVWAVHRDVAYHVDESRTHFGVRALGEWVAHTDSWLELAGVHGQRENTDLLGWGYDVGTTWTPEALAPFSFTLGYALGYGGDPSSSTDRTFRQSGLQDNNAKFAGVTSFRYYGELFDPELSNLGIVTAGVGARLARRTSLDLVLHHYRQDRILPLLADTGLDMEPDGLHADLGWEADLVLGWRQLTNWDLEVVGAVFHPSDAFPEGDDAYMVKVQLRRRF